jgi:hypothetical protein
LLFSSCLAESISPATCVNAPTTDWARMVGRVDRGK